MLNLERALNQDRLLRALTGLNRKAFDALLPSFEQAYEASRSAAKPARKRAKGGGRKASAYFHNFGFSAGFGEDLSEW